MRRFRSLAAAQTVPIRGDVAANLEQHVRLARLASEAGAQVVVFPELSLTGYELDLATRLAFSPDDVRLAPLMEEASTLHLTLIVGAPVRTGGSLCIGAFVVAPDGTVEIYTKPHLGAFGAGAGVDGVVPPAERLYFEPGALNPLVPVGHHTAAVAVCADTGRPSHPQAAADRGATIYLASMFVIPSEFERETAALGAYAAKHRMAVVFSNFGGPSGGLASAGRSAIWSERGERLAQLDASGAGVVVATEYESGWRAATVR